MIFPPTPVRYYFPPKEEKKRCATQSPEVGCRVTDLLTEVKTGERRFHPNQFLMCSNLKGSESDRAECDLSGVESTGGNCRKSPQATTYGWGQKAIKQKMPKKNLG